ncbi:hypothetical protein A3860_08980 [Niastella vici]|uniref:Ricin B lectin domain-containing protein n=1 Tax=Niastella vici TaxID=1703345 RepID=A0A1V9FHE0_9BACT|nr:RICIN domain-containing protein [Niastella vici]OQP57750.1 hypothetical protein A3860_08980 [Niastella vici]
MKKNLVLCLLFIAITARQAAAQAFVHPGLLHTEADFTRMRTKVNAGAQPWKGSWDLLVANSHSQLGYVARPTDTVRRGGTNQNYPQLYNDIAAAYQCALRWKISGDDAYADKSIAIMNAWSSTLKEITGNADRFLASGIYGYQFANAAEIMRTYSGWAAVDFTRFKNMMLNEFYPLCDNFLLNHNGACITNYWANWDLCNMAAILAIGVLCDRRDLYNRAIDYFKTGAGNGSIMHAVWYLHSATLGQWQESGRDQGHCTLGIGLLASFCEMAWNQGDDMYGYDSNRFMKGAEYVAQYNIGNTVPYTTYTWGNGQNCAQMSQTVISDASRGNLRPVWEMVYNHYANRLGIAVPGMAAYAQLHRPEGGGGNYGTASGGFDQLGFGSLTFTRDPFVANTVANGTYKIYARHSGKALDVLNNGTANGSQVQQWTANTCACQQWTLAFQSSGSYMVTGVGSGKALDINSASTADGAKVQIWTSTGGNNQRFTFIPAGNGYYRITPVHSGKCLDVNGGSTADGALVQQWTYLAAANQQWQLVPVSGARMVTTENGTTTTEQNTLLITPNPAQKQVTVYFKEKATIQVYNANGQLMYSANAQGSRHTIDISRLAPGSYFVKVNQGAGNVVRTIIKE